jgi:predicted TIM-barrel fold metal-dependent hydrolase
VTATLQDVRIIDTDSHVTEPPDLWTSRLAAKWADVAPRVEVRDNGDEFWVLDGRFVGPPGFYSVAGWRDPLPSFPPTLKEADPATFDPVQRLQRLDQYGVYAQLLYPNLIAFHPHAFVNVGKDFATACVRAYNDFVTDFASADPARLIPLTMLPFWDVEASVIELERCAAKGHRGLIFSAFFDSFGLPDIIDQHWRPILEAAQGLELPVNLHIAQLGASSADVDEAVANIRQLDRVRSATSIGFLSNVAAIATLVGRGACHDYPRLKFVSVESGFGFVPFVLESLDWQFENHGIYREHPEWKQPSEYFRDQVYATFWFERPSADALVEWQDNVMFETDFPHPTSLSPGPATPSLLPSEMAEKSLGHLPQHVVDKILHDNAAKIYHLT